MQSYYIYILASQHTGTLYVGITRDIVRRVAEHKQGTVPGFTQTHHVHMLVYYEETTDVRTVIEREKQLKSWGRKRKIELIESKNPQWIDLYDSIR